jgi:hypothetical protein
MVIFKILSIYNHQPLFLTILCVYCIFFIYLQDKRKFDDSMIEDDSDDGMVEKSVYFL